MLALHTPLCCSLHSKSCIQCVAAEQPHLHVAGHHDARVAGAAAEAGLQLRPRSVRVFDEVVDIVNFDLVIVLDHFDLTEVGSSIHPPTLVNSSSCSCMHHCAPNVV